MNDDEAAIKRSKPSSKQARAGIMEQIKVCSLPLPTRTRGVCHQHPGEIERSFCSTPVEDDGRDTSV